MGFRASRRHRQQTATYWEMVGRDRYAKPRVTIPVPLKVRWVPGKREVVSPDGNTIAVDIAVISNQDLVIGSLMRLGTLAETDGVEAETYQVVTFKSTPDTKARRYVREAGLMRYYNLEVLAAIDHEASTVSVSDASIGTDVTTTVTVTVRNIAGQLVEGAAVALSATGVGNTITPISGVTDDDGVFEADFSSSSAGVKVVSATVDGTLLDDTVTIAVTFDPYAVDAFLGFYWPEEGDQGYVSLTGAKFISNQIRYVGTTSASAFASLSKFTMAFFLSMDTQDNTILRPLFSKSDWAGVQMCFDCMKNADKTVQFFFAGSLTDHGSISIRSSQLLQSGPGSLQKLTHVAIVFDGTQTGNANRLKMYFNGVLDPSPTFVGTIPAATTASNALFMIGHSQWRGASGLSSLVNGWMFWDGVALTAAETALVGTLEGSSYPSWMFTGIVPALVPPVRHRWRMSEPSDGTAVVSRADTGTAGGITLSDDPALSVDNPPGKVSSATAIQWEDRTGKGHHLLSATLQASRTVRTPTVVADALNDLPGFHMDGLAIVQKFIGDFGLAEGPRNWSIYYTIELDVVLQSVYICGAENETGDGFLNTSIESWGFTETGDFAALFPFLNRFCASWGDYDAAKRACCTMPNATLEANTWYNVEWHYQDGDALPRLFINGEPIPLFNLHGVYAFTEVYSSGGGPPHRWAFGDDGEYDGANFIFSGTVVGHAVADEVLTGIQEQEIRVWIADRTGIAVVEEDIPATPSTLQASWDGRAVNLTWGDVDGVSCYHVYRSTDSGEEVLFSGSNVNSWSDTAPLAGDGFYRVSAATSGGESDLSNEVEVTTPTSLSDTFAGSGDASNHLAETGHKLRVVQGSFVLDSGGLRGGTAGVFNEAQYIVGDHNYTITARANSPSSAAMAVMARIGLPNGDHVVGWSAYFDTGTNTLQLKKYNTVKASGALAYTPGKQWDWTVTVADEVITATVTRVDDVLVTQQLTHNVEGDSGGAVVGLAVFGNTSSFESIGVTL